MLFYRERRGFRRTLDVVVPYHNCSIPKGYSEEMLSEDR